MMDNNRQFHKPLGIFACLAIVSVANTASAVVIASDNASNPAYASESGGAWKGQYPNNDQFQSNPPGNDDGGTGFEPWDFSGGYHLANEAADQGGGPGAYGTTNHFIDGVDFPTTSFNDLGAPAFGLANVRNYGGLTTVARRRFTQPLLVGDTISADFDTPAELEDWPFFHFPWSFITFRNGAGATTFTINAGNSAFFAYNWQFNDKNGVDQDVGTAAGLGGPLANTATSDGSRISLEITNATSGSETGRVTFDGLTPFDIAFIDGLPTSIEFVLYQNNAETTPVGPGDYNDDNQVDAADYVLWRDGGPLANETQTIGSVTAEDYTEWRANFGNSASPTGEHAFYFDNLLIERPSGSSLGGAVPEPSSITLFLLGFAAVARRRRSRRSTPGIHE